MRLDEVKFYPCGDYMPQQKRLNPEMRTELIYWLFQLEPALKVSSLSVHVAINLIDSYLWKR